MIFMTSMPVGVFIMTVDSHSSQLAAMSYSYSGIEVKSHGLE